MPLDDETTDSEKIQIAGALVQEAPPGEFHEVWNDLRVLVNNDQLLAQCAPAADQYHKDQLTTIRYDPALPKTLLTNYNELPEGRYFDPNTKKSFKFNALTQQASDVQPYEPPHVDEKLEAFRKAVQSELDNYVLEHYHKSGMGVVFVFNGHLAITIESHLFQPKNYWNGRWRSTWEIPPLDKSGKIDVKGISRINVHYYEDGNVQLCTKKDLVAHAEYSSDAADTAKSVLAAIQKSEGDFENAVLHNYNVMSDNTFKMLRRRLPITRAKFDWTNFHSYRIAQEINK
ncbi:F-actin-capping protein subunit alpha [Aphelenchoides fujianensis]|nr:F-actin-capping protein subunit alpha [Aphelenchoides fujianensis]